MSMLVCMFCYQGGQGDNKKYCVVANKVVVVILLIDKTLTPYLEQWCMSFNSPMGRSNVFQKTDLPSPYSNITTQTATSYYYSSTSWITIVMKIQYPSMMDSFDNILIFQSVAIPQMDGTASRLVWKYKHVGANERNQGFISIWGCQVCEWK